MSVQGRRGQMFRIGEFSKMCKTTIKTLRYYDEAGLLKPEETDKFTNYRFYTTNQLVRFHRIQAFRQIGLPISEIRLILSGCDEKTFLQKRKSELVSELAENQRQLSRIEFILQGKEEELIMDYVATIKELPGCIVYSTKMTLPNYDAYFEAIPAIGERITKQYPDLKCAVPEYCFIVYLDGEYREKDINIEFCEAVDKMWPDFDDFKFKEMKSQTAVSVMHKGPYAGLSKAYAFAFRWIAENGYTAADNPRENYIDGIWNKENEEDWLTELQIPVARK
ncbi:MAG: MerR family transcriptional regulator [Clostridiales bacterium]|nr:MerR family transcriptional regulator [Clostridiales bacterium]